MFENWLQLDPYVDPLLNMFLSNTKDEDEDVRNNAVYGAGELALHGGQVTTSGRSVIKNKEIWLYSV